MTPTPLLIDVVRRRLLFGGRKKRSLLRRIPRGLPVRIPLSKEEWNGDECTITHVGYMTITLRSSVWRRR